MSASMTEGARSSRRRFLRDAAAVALGLGALRAFDFTAVAQAQGPAPFGSGPGGPYGPLQNDPSGILELPRGFSYRVLSRAGDLMDDGLLVPGRCDGMGAFSGPGGSVLLLRNHELHLGHVRRGEASALGVEALPAGIDPARIYDIGHGRGAHPGGVSALLYDPIAGLVREQWLRLAGTNNNCAGGITPWGSWVSCEETHLKASEVNERAHGYNFEVPATLEKGLVEPVPLRAMGRFRHEAIAVDPETGIVYQTEDRDDGLITRFLPDVPGQLARGGRLEALAIADHRSCDTRGWERPGLEIGRPYSVEWIALDHVDTDTDDLRERGFVAGAARFARGEGMWYGSGRDGDAVYFAATTGGIARKGQLFRLDPRGQTLTLWIEPNDGHVLENADNLTVAPWGDVILAEDLASTPVEPHNRLIGVTPDGILYPLARNVMNDSELAGVCFDPAGQTLFVNIYEPGWTLAITGPWLGS